MSLAIVALGSNIEPRLSYLQEASELIKHLGENFKYSSVYETEPVGFNAETHFFNAVVAFDTNLTPLALLNHLLAFEKEIGRERNDVGAYESRKIDLDLIAFSAQVIITEKVVVPHPEFRKRQFVLQPFCELLPEWIDPITQINVKKLLGKCFDKSAVNVRIEKILQ